MVSDIKKHTMKAMLDNADGGTIFTIEEVYHSMEQLHQKENNTAMPSQGSMMGKRSSEQTGDRLGREAGTTSHVKCVWSLATGVKSAVSSVRKWRKNQANEKGDGSGETI